MSAVDARTPKSTPAFWQTFLLFGLFAVLCISLWLGEIFLRHGWAGLSWLYNGFPWASIPICLLTVAAFLFPFYRKPGVTNGRKVLTLLALWLVAFVFFCLFRAMCFRLWSRFYSPSLFSMVVSLLIMGVGAPALLGGALRLIEVKLTFLGFVLINLALVGALVLGLLTIQVIPGFGGSRWIVDSVKMGYPMFWLPILLGGAGELGRRLVNRRLRGGE